MEETNLKQVLKECNKSAKTGYKIASAQEKNLNRALASAQEKVQSTIIDFNSSPCYAPEATELLEVQLVEIRDTFNLRIPDIRVAPSGLYSCDYLCRNCYLFCHDFFLLILR